MNSVVLGTVALGLHWPTLDPFLFCAHHRDNYPPGNEQMGLDPTLLSGRNIGSDFTLKDGWRMYHGRKVPGFPQHPHRGFETITIAQSGYVDHSDSMGAQARFGRGDVQWMTAGRGVVHAEMFPLVKAEEGNPCELFQIWLNLPAKSKKVAPYFTMLWSETIEWIEDQAANGAYTRVAVVAGRLKGAMGAATPPDSWAADPAHGVNIWQIVMEPNSEWALPPTAGGKTRMLYAYKTEGLSVAGRAIHQATGLQLRPDIRVPLQNRGQTSELLLLEGAPIGEPIAQHGPFVMNSRTEIAEAFLDYQRNRFGGWPWPVDDPVVDRAAGRFARHADGTIERPDPT